MKAWLASGAALLLASAAPAQPAGVGAISSTLQPRLAALAHAGQSRVGLAAIDLNNGEMISVNGADRFPMASTVKVAIAAAFLHQVQLGRQSLDRIYGMGADERRKASRIGNMRGYGRTASGAQLIDLMLTRSDNSSADILLGAVGGTVVVGEWLRQAGVSGQRVDRSIADLLSAREVRTRVRVGKKRRKHWITVTVPRSSPVGDVRDSSTPEAMATLLAKLRSGDLLDSQHTAYLFDVMARCRTGGRRLKALLPGDTFVAHKTGTLDGVANDVGIIGLPNGTNWRWPCSSRAAAATVRAIATSPNSHGCSMMASPRCRARSARAARACALARGAAHLIGAARTRTGLIAVAQNGERNRSACAIQTPRQFRRARNR